MLAIVTLLGGSDGRVRTVPARTRRAVKRVAFIILFKVIIKCLRSEVLVVVSLGE
jgi:hypothetical protein